jgi:hypothetical protein
MACIQWTAVNEDPTGHINEARLHAADKPLGRASHPIGRDAFWMKNKLNEVLLCCAITASGCVVIQLSVGSA